MKKIALLLMLLVLVPVHASALDTNDLLSLVAMPLAVDAVSRVTGVPQDQLAQFAESLNQANVPPQQFVQTMRYAPVALQQPDFYPYVETQTSQGVTGSELVTVIDRRLPQYGVEVQPYEATPSSVMSDSFIPAIAAALSGGDRSSLLSLIAMPLAVAAVADIAGVPEDQLATLLSSLNQADVPPAQFVDTLRYIPVALIEQPQFVPYVQTQVANGVTGTALITEIRQQPWYPQPTPSSSSITVVNSDYVPQTVRTRVAEARVHPHGGPPGLLKKQLGLQTGAEVVHGGSVATAPQPRFVPPGQEKKEGRAEAKLNKQERGHGHGRGRGHERGEVRQVLIAQPPMASSAPVVPIFVPPGQQNGEGQGHGHGRGAGGQGPPGQQKEKGGKGHGKD